MIFFLGHRERREPFAVTCGHVGALRDQRRDRIHVVVGGSEIDKASEDARRETMDAALARTMHDLATDPELAKALASVQSAATSEPVP